MVEDQRRQLLAIEGQPPSTDEVGASQHGVAIQHAHDDTSDLLGGAATGARAGVMVSNLDVEARIAKCNPNQRDGCRRRPTLPAVAVSRVI